MENLRTSSYIIPIKLDNKKYMLIHGYTGAIDVINEDLATKLIEYDHFCDDTFSPATKHILEKRGYITTKTKEEEFNYTERMAQALHKRDKILYKNFTWIITYNCNFRCPYCFENRSAKDSSIHTSFTEEKVNETFDAMNRIEPRVQLRSNIITLYGGEPLLKENKSIITYIINKGQKEGYKFEAITNGYDLDKFTDLLSPNMIYRIQITIDGTKELHNRKRKHFKDPNTFDKIISNIQLIFSLNLDIKISIRVNIDNNNLDDFVELKRYFSSLGFLDHENFTIYSAQILENNSITAQDKADLNILSTKDYIQKSSEMKILSSCNGYDTIYKKIHDAIINQKAIPLRATFCSSQSGSYVFSPSGEIYPCWEVIGNKHYLIGHLSNNSFLWNNEILNKWRSYNISSSLKCKYCKYAFLCGGGCQALKNNHCTYFQEILKTVANDVYKQVCTDMFNQ